MKDVRAGRPPAAKPFSRQEAMDDLETEFLDDQAMLAAEIRSPEDKKAAASEHAEMEMLNKSGLVTLDDAGHSWGRDPDGLDLSGLGHGALDPIAELDSDDEDDY